MTSNKPKRQDTESGSKPPEVQSPKQVDLQMIALRKTIACLEERFFELEKRLDSVLTARPDEIEPTAPVEQELQVPLADAIRSCQIRVCELNLLLASFINDRIQL